MGDSQTLYIIADMEVYIMKKIMNFKNVLHHSKFIFNAIFHELLKVLENYLKLQVRFVILF